ASALLACSSAPKPTAAHGEVVLSVRGKVVHGPFVYGRDDLPGLRRRSFRARPPAGGPVATFEGVNVAALLAERMEVARDADTAIVRSRDGYAVAVPLVSLRQLRPVLADRADGQPLADWARAAGLR